MPHRGSYISGETVKGGYCFNEPLYLNLAPKTKGTAPKEKSFVKCDNPNVVIDTIKKADKDNDLIIRLYECHETTGEATLEFGFDVKSVKMVTLLEHDKKGSVKLKGNKVTFNVQPFKIVTLKVEF